MAYASYSKGYRAGAINGTAYASPNQLTFVDPEEITAYETGVKSELFDGRMRLNGSVFFYDYKNQQLQEIIGIVPFLRNVPKAEALGFELDMTAQVADSLLVNVGYGYLDSEYKELTLSGVDLSGNQFSNAPDQTFNIALDWTLMDNGAGQIHFRPSAVYAGDTWLSPANEKPSSAVGAVLDNSRLFQDAYWLVNAGLTWERENLAVSANVKNLFEEEYLVYGNDLRAAVGVDFLVRGQRRTYGVDVSWKF
jgi:outer membrane receptor protein involved in Fe transport